jgi:DNA adenine methylase
MSQLLLPGMPERDKIVNVASVPHRSPFRYPGGKTWLVPKIRRWLCSQGGQPRELVEPFAGGGIVGLSVAFEGLAKHVTLVELDEQVAAVWQTILEGNVDWLIKRIGDFDCTLDNVVEEMAKTPRSTQQRAFQTILKNRTYHGGILAAGSAPLKNGENGKGVSSRWYATTIQRRIADIASIRDRITFVHGDGLEVMERVAEDDDVVHFIDPPYTAAGKKAGRRLYNCFELDHERLFDIAAGVSGDVLLTYDDAEGVRDLAASHGFEVELVAMQNTHLAKMKELLIGPDLSWAREE